MLWFAATLFQLSCSTNRTCCDNVRLCCDIMTTSDTLCVPAGQPLNANSRRYRVLSRLLWLSERNYVVTTQTGWFWNDLFHLFSKCWIMPHVARIMKNKHKSKFMLNKCCVKGIHRVHCAILKPRLFKSQCNIANETLHQLSSASPIVLLWFILTSWLGGLDYHNHS